MSSDISDIGYTRCIEMEIVPDPQLPPVAYRPYILPLKQHKWFQKNL